MRTAAAVALLFGIAPMSAVADDWQKIDCAGVSLSSIKHSWVFNMTKRQVWDTRPPQNESPYKFDVRYGKINWVETENGTIVIDTLDPNSMLLESDDEYGGHAAYKCLHSK